LTSALVLAVSLLAAPTASLAQGGAAASPGTGYAPPTTGQQPPTGYAPPTTGQPPPPPSDAPGYAPPPAGYAPPTPPPGYAPGYGSPAYPPPPRGYPSEGYYPPGYVPPGARLPPENLHDGFYLRLHLGGGFTHVSGGDAFGDPLTAQGGSVSFGIALGAAITPNFIVFGNLFYAGIAAPDVSIGGLGSGVSNSTVLLTGIGPGAAYYFEPINIYLTGTVAAMEVEIEDANNNPLYQSKVGIGVQVTVGKEWWTSQNWGLGLAGELIAASMKDKSDSNVTWTSSSYSLLFSATYN
jgi:hypothetical protein